MATITVKALIILAKSASSSGTPQFLWEGGLGVRASPLGKLSFVAQIKQGKVSTRQTLGYHPGMSIEDARLAFSALLTEVRSGVDLRSKRAQKRIETLTDIRLGEAVERYLTTRGDQSNYWKDNRARFDKKVLPFLGSDRLLKTLTKADIRELLLAHNNNRLLYAMLSAFLNWCASEDYIPVSPMATLTKPATGPARDRILTDDEIKSLWLASEGLEPVWRAFYRVLLLTACRRDEVSGMKWVELDFEAHEWTIPKGRTKNGKAHTIKLSPLVISILQSLPSHQASARHLRQNASSSVFVFPSGTGVTPISAYSDNKARLDALMIEGTPPWRVHDLRRTAASGMAKLGFQPHIIERVLNHVSGVNGGLVSVYQRHEYQEERALLAWSNYVAGLLNESHESQSTNILAFKAVT